MRTSIVSAALVATLAAAGASAQTASRGEPATSSAPAARSASAGKASYTSAETEIGTLLDEPAARTW